MSNIINKSETNPYTLTVIFNSKESSGDVNVHLVETLIKTAVTTYAAAKNTEISILAQKLSCGYKATLAESEMKMICQDDCVYKGKRHQKCTCCARNKYLKDCYIPR